MTTEPTTVRRTIDVRGGLVRHLFRQHLRGEGITYSEGAQSDYGHTIPFTITATSEQWTGIEDWLKREGDQ